MKIKNLNGAKNHRFFSMNKKAISPLLSTFLLLAFAASLGAVVINWGSSQSALAIYPISCKTTGLELLELNNQEQICYENGRLDFTIMNIGDPKLLSLKITVIGENKFYTEVIDEDLDQADIIQKSVYYGEEIGNIQKVFIVPKIKENNVEKFCPRNNLEVENINPC